MVNLVVMFFHLGNKNVFFRKIEIENRMRNGNGADQPEDHYSILGRHPHRRPPPHYGLLGQDAPLERAGHSGRAPHALPRSRLPQVYHRRLQVPPRYGNLLKTRQSAKRFKSLSSHATRPLQEDRRPHLGLPAWLPDQQAGVERHHFSGDQTGDQGAGRMTRRL